jgi:ADP-ribose pyrophosphatase YjhB (NUDIX family)
MNRSYPERPFVGVGVVVWRGDMVLLVRRGKPPRQGRWSLPGGIQETGETVFEAGRREVLEETGLAVDIGGLVDVVDSIQRDDAGRVRLHYTLVDLVAESPAGDAVAGDDADAAAWFERDRIAELDLWSETVRIIALSEAKRGPP